MTAYSDTLLQDPACDFEKKIQAYIDEFYVVEPDCIRWFAQTFGFPFFERLKVEYDELAFVSM